MAGFGGSNGHARRDSVFSLTAIYYPNVASDNRPGKGAPRAKCVFQNLVYSQAFGDAATSVQRLGDRLPEGDLARHQVTQRNLRTSLRTWNVDSDAGESCFHLAVI